MNILALFSIGKKTVSVGDKNFRVSGGLYERFKGDFKELEGAARHLQLGGALGANLRRDTFAAIITIEKGQHNSTEMKKDFLSLQARHEELEREALHFPKASEIVETFKEIEKTVGEKEKEEIRPIFDAYMHLYYEFHSELQYVRDNMQKLDVYAG